MDNPCFTIQHVIDNVAISNDVVKIDGSHGNFSIERAVTLSQCMNITFTSYNGVAWIGKVRGASKLSRYGVFLAIDTYTNRKECEIMVVSINFRGISLVVTTNNIISRRSIIATIRVKNCHFDFSKMILDSTNWLYPNLASMNSHHSLIVIDNCTIKANYQIGILFYPIDHSCIEFRSTKIIIKNTRIEDAKYTVYAIMEKCTDKLWKRSFKLYIISSILRSGGKYQSRTPQISAVVGKLYKDKVWLSVYMQNSRFENFSVLTNTAAVMDVRGPSIVVIRNCTFNGNVGNRGGALSFQSSFLKVVDSQFYNNQAGVIALCADKDRGGCGGAIFVTGMEGPMRMRIYNSSFIDNMAVCFGSAVYLGYFQTISVEKSQFSTRFRSVSDTIWYSYSENLKIDRVSFEAREQSTLSGGLFFAKLKTFNFMERAPIFKCPLGSTINTSASSSGISGNDKITEVRCQYCPKGTYTLTPSTLSNGTKDKLRKRVSQCHSCSFGSSCLRGIKPNPNFWGYVHKSKAFMIVCPPGYCCQTSDQCIALNSCSSRRTGRLCGKCKRGYFQSVFSKDCLEENNCKTGYFWAVAIFMCLLFTLLFIFLQDIFSVVFKVLNLAKLMSVISRGVSWLRGKLSPAKTDKHEVERRSGNEESCCDPINNELPDDMEGKEVESDDETKINESETGPNNNSATAGLIKIVFFFYQIHSTLTLYKSNREILYLRDFEAFVMSIFNLNAQVPLGSEFHCPFHGIGSMTKVWVKALFPVSCLIVTGSLYASLHALSYCLSRSDFFQRYSTKAKPRLLTVILQLILLGYSTLTSSILSLVTCISLVNGDRILYIDGNVSCYQPWQYVILIFIVCWAIPLIYALHKLPRCMRNGEIGIRGVYTALLLPLPFAAYTMVRGLRKTRGAASDDIFIDQSLSFSNSPAPRKDVDIVVSKLLNVIEGPFRYKTSGEKRQKLSWEPILLLQRIVLSLCHTFVLEPGTRSLLLLLLIVIFLYMNACYQPFNSCFLNTINGIAFIFLCTTGIVNGIYGYIYEYGSVPKGPLSQLLNIFDYIEIIVILIFPVIAAIILTTLVFAKLSVLAASMAGLLVAKCKRCQSNDD